MTPDYNRQQIHLKMSSLRNLKGQEKVVNYKYVLFLVISLTIFTFKM